MEPNSTERKFREQLEKREIQPSADSWEKLSLQLEMKEKSFGRRLLWTGIAAAVIAGVFYFADTGSRLIPQGPQIVTAPQEEQEKEKKVQESLLPQIKTENGTGKEEDFTKKGAVTKAARPKVKTGVAVLAENTKEEPEQGFTGEPERAAEISEVAIVAVSDRVSEGETTDLDSEVDSLLNAALADVNRKESGGSAGNYAEAAHLLREIEMQTEYSLKEKLFDLVKDGYIRTKTLVASRNN